MRRWHTLGALSLATGVALASYSVLVEPRWVATRRFDVPVLRAPARRDLLLAHISDLHLWPGHAHIRRALEGIAAADPDVVVATGDLLGHPDVVDEAVGLLARLGRGRIALAVLGSNDVYAPVFKNPVRYLRAREPGEPTMGPRLDTHGLRSGLRNAGWRVVDNQALRVDSPVGVIDVRAVGDAHKGLDDLDAVDWGLPDPEVALALGMTHAPYQSVLDRMDRATLDLALAGHTHGGQVRLPGIGALVGNCDLPLSQVRGLSGYGAGLALHVSAGLGQSRYAPIRFACRPEVSLLRLTRRL